MTVLSSCQEASRLMGKSAPTAIYLSTSPYEVELQSIANEAAKSITKGYDWRKFTTLKTQSGDGAATSFSLPTDYDRMPQKASIYLTSAQRQMQMITDLDIWLENRLRTISNPVGEWIMLGGTLQIYAGNGALGVTDSAKYYYQSNLIVTPAVGSNKTAFTIDTDVFRLDERLLALEIVWRWKAMKGLDYAEEMQNAEIAKAQEITRDKGSRIIKIGAPRMSDDCNYAYPGTIVSP